MRVTLHATGRRFLNVLVDTGSSMTWLPAQGTASALRLSGDGPGVCEPTGGGNFSHRYADGSAVSGLRCRTVMSLAGVEFTTVIGAATHVAESEQLRSSGLSMAWGVLALSPAPESSFNPLMQALAEGSRRLSLCAPRQRDGHRGGRMVIAGECEREDADVAHLA